MVKLSAPAIRTLRHYWANPPITDQGRAWGPAEKVRVLQLVISTDASKVAWGAHIHGKWKSTAIQGLLNLEETSMQGESNEPIHFPTQLKNMRGAFDATDRTEHIHILEYEAVYHALQGLGDEIQDCCIRLWCDNMVVVAGLTKEFS